MNASPQGLALAALLALAAPLLPGAQTLASPAAAPVQDELGVVTLDDYQLSLDFSKLPGFEQPTEGIGDQVKARFRGKLGRSDVFMTLFVLDAKRFGLNEPMDVTKLVESNKADQDRAAGGPVFAYDEMRSLPGAFGVTPFASLGIDTAYDGTKAVSDFYALGGILPKIGYALEVRAEPTLEKKARKQLETFLAKGIAWAGTPRDPNWTDEEVEERWKAGAPDKVQEKDKLFVVRTKYYCIMTNLKKGTASSFGKKIDKCYEEIRKVYPFEDVEGQRLLPIFYFVQPDQYWDWCVKNLGWTKDKARQSAGVATGDVYATYHQSANAPVHIHEATHQIFGNRLHLGGGGSWFQEGVAEYIESDASSLTPQKGIIKRENHMPLAQFFVVPSMLYSAKNGVKGGSGAGDNYKQAATVVEFVRHSKFGKDKFQEYIHAVGACPRGHLPAIEKAIKKVFGVDIDGFEKEYVAYWSKRKSPKKK